MAHVGRIHSKGRNGMRFQHSVACEPVLSESKPFGVMLLGNYRETKAPVWGSQPKQKLVATWPLKEPVWATNCNFLPSSWLSATTPVVHYAPFGEKTGLQTHFRPARSGTCLVPSDLSRSGVPLPGPLERCTQQAKTKWRALGHSP